MPRDRRARNASPANGSPQPGQAEVQGLVALYTGGRLIEAETQARKLAKKFPMALILFNILGAAQAGQGKFREAAATHKRALKIKPDYPEAHYNLGYALQELGKFKDAADSYKRALRFKPDFLEAQSNLGVALQRLGKLDRAIASYRQVIGANPDYADAHNNLGNALSELGQFDEAAESYRRALQLVPNFAEAHKNLGKALYALGRIDEAIASIEKSLERKPDNAEAHNVLGVALQALGRLDEAIASYDAALRIEPDNAEAYNNLGTVLGEQGKHEEAVVRYRRAVESDPGLAAAHSNLGVSLRELGRFDDAVACCRQALAIEPSLADAHSNLGNALYDLKRFEQAQASYKRALEIDPEHPNAFNQAHIVARQVCDWSAFENARLELDNHVHEASLAVDPFLFLACSENPGDQLRCAEQYVGSKIGSGVEPVPQKVSQTDERIRIAYLSADFHKHATAYLMAELFELHDRERFEITGISFGVNDGSEMRRRLTDAFGYFADMQASSDREVAELIADQNIHIAVDLKGYTKNSRPGILACRPAPVQVNYLGYPGTMGADFIDYIVVDPFVVPPDEQVHFAERLVQLPDCYQVNDSKRVIADQTPSRTEAGLPEEGFVYCCFNKSYKLTPGIFEIWMRLLGAVRGSVLWLFDDNETASRNLREKAQASGVDPERLVFAGHADLADHLARHRLADLFLDTLPYNAHTTASDALWAGLPIVTCAGPTFASRVGGSLLNAVGLPELVTENLADYEALALKLANEPDLLAEMRARLADNRLAAPLFDSKRFCRNLEAAYETMVETWTGGGAPTPITVAPQTTAALEG